MEPALENRLRAELTAAVEVAVEMEALLNTETAPDTDKAFAHGYRVGLKTALGLMGWDE